MMTRLLALAAAAGMTLLTAPLPAQVRSQTAKSYSDRLAALSDLQRRGSLRHAILDSGEKCQSGSKGAFQAPYKNMEMWVARCGTTDYGAFIGPDGTVQVSSCTYLVSVKWPACRKLD